MSEVWVGAWFGYAYLSYLYIGMHMPIYQYGYAYLSYLYPLQHEVLGLHTLVSPA